MVGKPGKLPYKCVIHAVGPMWDPSNADKSLYTLARTFLNAFQCANGERFRSVAAPAISSGKNIHQNGIEFKTSFNLKKIGPNDLNKIISKYVCKIGQGE